MTVSQNETQLQKFQFGVCYQNCTLRQRNNKFNTFIQTFFIQWYTIQ